MLRESVLDDTLVKALFLGLCYWSENVDVVLWEALFVGLCYVMGVRSVMMFGLKHCF